MLHSGDVRHSAPDAFPSAMLSARTVPMSWSSKSSVRRRPTGSLFVHQTKYLSAQVPTGFRGCRCRKTSWWSAHRPHARIAEADENRRSRRSPSAPTCAPHSTHLARNAGRPTRLRATRSRSPSRNRRNAHLLRSDRWPSLYTLQPGPTQVDAGAGTKTQLGAGSGSSLPDPCEWRIGDTLWHPLLHRPRGTGHCRQPSPKASTRNQATGPARRFARWYPLHGAVVAGE